MLVIAKSVKGKEFLYDPRTARKVSKASANYILEVVNKYKFLLDSSDSEIWHIHEIDEYDAAFVYAQYQAFTVRNGIVSARSY